MRVLNIDEIDEIRPLISKFEDLVKDSFPSSNAFIEIIRDWLQTGYVKIALVMDDCSNPFGLAAIDLKRNQILAILVDDLDGNLESDEVYGSECELIDWCFHELKEPPIRIDFPRLTMNLKDLLLKRGYVEIKRARMIATRESFVRGEETKLPEGYLIEPYMPENRGSVAEVIARANENNIDSMIYPEFLGSKDAALYFLKRLEENAFGDYREGYSKVLIASKRIVGCCMISVTGDIAIIPDVGLLPDYQGRGLGKALIMKTIQDILDFESSLTEIALSVTLSNPAKHLYEKIGFTISDELSSIVYMGNDVGTK